jgi:surface protein
MKHFKHFLLLKIICSIVLFTNCSDSYDPVSDNITNTADDDDSRDIDNSSDGVTESAIFLAENGVTIRASDLAIIGEKYELDGISYLVVDSTILIEMITNEEDITKVVTTHITSLNNLFNSSPSWNLSWSYGVNFNQDIGSWDVVNVNSMIDAFIDLPSFNQDISHWEVISVTDMSGTFANCPSFNQNISDWNVSKVIKMGGMFAGATSFNQDLSSCGLNNVIDFNKFSINAEKWILPKPNFTNCTE